MKFSAPSLTALVALTAAASSASAFVVVPDSAAPRGTAESATVALSMSNDESSTTSVGRRAVLGTFGAMAAAAAAGLAPEPAAASLLDEFGTDPKKIDQESATSKKTGAVVAQPKGESSMEPNLRSNYYYPTNKKRYLPRIKKCSDAIPGAAELIGREDWEGISDFATKIADDTILPMKLYTSSLSGGGTNVKVAFAKDMMNEAQNFEKAQKKLLTTIKKKDQQGSSRALEDMSQALFNYRTTGKLLGPDGGGDIPSVDEIRRSACRVQGRTFEMKVKDRDARLREAATQ